MTSVINQPGPSAPPAPDHPARMPLHWRVLGALAGIALVAWIGISFVSNTRHNEAVNSVMNQVTAQADTLQFGDVEIAFADFVTGADEMGNGLDHLLTIGSASEPTPIEVGRPNPNTIVVKYNVNEGGGTSCVVSVLKPSGYRIEAVSESCGSGAMPRGVLDYIAEG